MSRVIIPGIIALSLAGNAWGQTANISVSVTLPPPTPITITVNQSVVINGVTYTVSGNLTLTPTITPPAGSSAITSITDITGAPLTTAAAGRAIVVKGTGLGSFGTATVAGLPAAVQSWTPTSVTLTLPTAGSAAATVTGPIILKPGDAPQATGPAFTITGLVADLPTDTGKPTWESPVIAVSQNNESPVQLDCDQYQNIPLAPVNEALIPAPGPNVLGVSTLPAGALLITGEGFGETTGKIWIEGWPVDVVSWGDAQISVNYAVPGDDVNLLVMNSPGRYYQGLVEVKP